MLQSLSMKEFEENAFDSFGTVIVDEFITYHRKFFQEHYQKFHSNIQLV